MINIIERIKKRNYRRWHIFANVGMHSLQQMNKRNLTMKDIHKIIKMGEFLPNADPRCVLCVGKKDGKFFTLVLQPLFDANAWNLWTPRPSYPDEMKQFKKIKRNKQRLKK